MPTTSQSPSHNTSQAQPKQVRSRKAATPAETATGRAGSAGGIVLEAKKSTETAAAAIPAANATTGPNRQRRRPRKLNKEPTTGPNAAPAPAPATTTAAATKPPETELQALKERVRGLEAKVEELYLTAEARTGRSPRRRGKGRKSSSATQVPTLSTTQTAQIEAIENEGEEEEEADEELLRLEDELENARRDLEVFQPRSARSKRPVSDNYDDDVEEIPRNGDGGGNTVLVGDRQVTLSGSYRIPLPATLDMKDVQKIQSGVSAAQSVAKSFLEQRRAAQAARAPPSSTASASAARPKSTARKASAPPNMDVSQESSGSSSKSWGEWIGGYSMAISRAVSKIEAEAAIENQRPAVPRESVKKGSAGSVRKTPAVGVVGGVSGGAKRPSVKGRRANLSSEQVQGLMS